MNWLALSIIVLLIILIITIIFYFVNRQVFYQEKGTVLVVPKSITVKKWDNLQDIYPPALQANYKQAIPLHIVQTNFSHQVPGRLKEVVNYLQAMNGEYEIRYFDDESARQFLLKHHTIQVVQAYDDIIPGAFKSDLFRAAYLCTYGGIYMDTGMIPLVAFRNILQANTKFMSVKDHKIRGSFGPYIYNALIACTAQHPIMLAYLDKIVANIQTKSYTENVLSVTGPGALGEVFKQVTNIDIDKSGYYPQNIMILEHLMDITFLGKGKTYLVFQNTNVIYTKYIEYRKDQQDIQKISNKKHYGQYYNKREIYGEGLVVNDNLKIQQMQQLDDSTIEVKFFHDITVNATFPIKNNTTLNGTRQIIYYTFSNRITQALQRLNLYYLQNMNSEIEFTYSDTIKQDKYIDITYFFLYPLRYYQNHITDGDNTIFKISNILNSDITGQLYQIIKL